MVSLYVWAKMASLTAVMLKRIFSWLCGVVKTIRGPWGAEWLGLFWRLMRYINRRFTCLLLMIMTVFRLICQTIPTAPQKLSPRVDSPFAHGGHFWPHCQICGDSVGSIWYFAKCFSDFVAKSVCYGAERSGHCSYNWEFLIIYFLNLPVCKTAVKAYNGPSTPEVVTW